MGQLDGGHTCKGILAYSDANETRAVVNREVSTPHGGTKTLISNNDTSELR